MTTHAITRGTPPTLATRKPTGMPTWPMLLLAGGQKCGKTYTAAELSASDLVDRTFVVEVGEGAVDQYGAIPGARFEILEHDGTFLGIARQVWAATLVPRGPSGKPHAIVLDSATEVWDLVTGEQQELSNVRRDRRTANTRGAQNAAGAEDAVITMDQWNAAKKRWRALVDLLRSHDGPVIWTARFEEVAKMGDNGRPVEGEKTWKIRTEKNLPYEVDGIVEIPAPREFYVTGIRSLRFQLEPGERRRVPGFTLDAMLRALGLDEEVGARHYVAPNTEAYVAEHDAEAAERAAVAAQPGQQPGPRQQQRTATRRTAEQWATAIGSLATYEAARALYNEANAAGQLELDVDGYTVAQRIQGKGEALRDAERASAQSVMTGKPAAAPASAPATPPADPAPPQEPDPAPAEAPAAADGDVPDVPTADTDGQGGEGHASEPGGEDLAEPDPIQSRRESARRKGTITALLEQWGNVETLDAAAVQEFRQTHDNVSTQRLGDWLQATIRENRGASA